MGVKLNAALGGSVELVPTNTASNYTATMPARTGTVAMDGPAFSAYQSTLQSVANNTFTKLQFQTEEFDTNSNYDNVTNYRFTPTVTGYYQISAANYFAYSQATISIYKNGTEYKRGISAAGGIYSNTETVSCLVYLNGSTDYVEAYAYQGSGSSQNTIADSKVTWFQGVLVRGA